MTANQIAYARLLEEQRAHKANEALTSKANAEIERSHRAGELETNRSNLARETENYRSNRARETETHRSAVAQESEANRSNLARELETNRANLANERIRDTANAITDAHYVEDERIRDKQADEAIRHNQATEAIQRESVAQQRAAAKLNADTQKEVARMNNGFNFRNVSNAATNLTRSIVSLFK